MSEEDQRIGAAVVARFGRRAHEIADELREAFQRRDGYRGGMLCKEMWEEPDLLMLVVSLLLQTPSSGPLATREELGMDVSEDEFKAAPWQVALNDQAEAAYLSEDFPAYARITTDSWVKAIVMDIRNYKVMEGVWPDVSFVLRGTLIADPGQVVAVASECLYRLAMANIQEEG